VQAFYDVHLSVGELVVDYLVLVHVDQERGGGVGGVRVGGWGEGGV